METERAEPQSRRCAHLIGASIQRSGHHFLASILRAFYKERIHYCGYYKVTNCCHSIPCTRSSGRTVVYQKHHDAEFTLPQDIPNVLYVVQYREPISEALSDLELNLKRRQKDGRPPCTATPLRFTRWLAKKAQYYTLFHDKWVAPRHKNAVLIDYKDLAAEPTRTVLALLSLFDRTASSERLSQAVAAVAEKRGGTETTYRARVIEDSPAFDRALFSAFESLILDRCPAYGFERLLDKVNYRNHSLYAAYRERRYRRANIDFSSIAEEPAVISPHGAK